MGNVILKFAEGLSKGLLSIIKDEITKGMYKFATLALKTPFKNIKKKFVRISYWEVCLIVIFR